VEMQIAGARLQREEAVMAMQSVTGGAGKLVLEESRTELRLLETRAARLQAAHDELRPLFAKGYITRDELDRSAADAEEAAARADLAARANRVLAEQTQPASEQAARLQVARRDSDLLNLQPQLESARAYVKTLEDLVGRCTIRAINPGLIVYDENLSVTPKRKVRAGDRVTPSQGIVTLPDLAAMAVETSVRESDVMMLAPGARVRARLDALPDVILTGKVARIGAIAQGSSPDLSESRFDVRIDLDRAAVPLRPSMNARIDIDTARPEAVLVPVTAVRFAEGRNSCLVETGGKWQTRFVTLGRSNSTDVEIIDGVAAGERVRLNPAAER
jgi:HlyD family secretion protein